MRRVSLFAIPLLTATILPDSSMSRELSPPTIDHVIVIVEQNHTFDSYFGTYPAAHGLSEVDRFPRSVRDPRRTIKPFLFTDELAQAFEPAPGLEPLSNGQQAAIRAYDAGRMQGFAIAQGERGFPPHLPMMHHDRSTAGPLWDLADQYVLFDQYYSSALGGSLANMLYLLAGESRGFSRGTKAELRTLGEGDLRTVFDELDARGVSWKYYVGGIEQLSPLRVGNGDYLRPGLVAPPQLYWAPVLAMRRFWEDRKLREGLATQQDFYADSIEGKLPAVSFILPSPTDHPLVPVEQGLGRLIGLINQVMKGPQWKKSVIFVVWDDWGGFYDHEPPPLGLGLRVPMLLVSPWAKHGHVSHVQHDHTSVLNFIVERFDLAPLSARQQAAPSFADAFQPSGEPRTGAALRIGEPQVDSTGGGPADLTLTMYVVLLLLTAVAVARLRARR